MQNAHQCTFLMSKRHAKLEWICLLTFTLPHASKVYENARKTMSRENKQNKCTQLLVATFLNRLSFSIFEPNFPSHGQGKKFSPDLFISFDQCQKMIGKKGNISYTFQIKNLSSGLFFANYWKSLPHVKQSFQPRTFFPKNEYITI